MSSAAAHSSGILTPAEYYEMERPAQEKHDYFQGEVYAMSGGTTNHSRIKTRLVRLLDTVLQDKCCEPLDSDQRIKVKATGLRTYPDASVFCEQPEYDEEDAQAETAVNPTVLFEVLSDSTEAYDRGLKAENYRQIASLKAYVLVAQDRPHVEVYERATGGHWILSEVEGIDATVDIGCIGVQLKLRELYQRVGLA